jgi:hypothetical protein
VAILSEGIERHLAPGECHRLAQVPPLLSGRRELLQQARDTVAMLVAALVDPVVVEPFE